MKNKHIAECDSCGGYISYDCDSYYQDNTHDGECTKCGKKTKGDCNEVDDFICMRGDYAFGKSKWKVF